MTRPIVNVFDENKNERIDREMNDAEFAQWQIDVKSYEDSLAKSAKAEADKAALLAKLGITADEAKLLLS
jgi:hypothetical protein